MEQIVVFLGSGAQTLVHPYIKLKNVMACAELKVFHLRNLSVLTDNNAPTLTPACDLTITRLIDPEPDEDATLPINGKKTTYAAATGSKNHAG